MYGVIAIPRREKGGKEHRDNGGGSSFFSFLSSIAVISLGDQAFIASSSPDGV